MKTNAFGGTFAAAAMLLSAPLAAQEADTVAASVEPAAEVAAPECELHVWPTENYLGVKMGLFSGFGIVGALADQAGHAKGVRTVKDLMREYLGPEVQMEELQKLDYLAKLGLDASKYEVIIEKPTPWNEDLKDNPELKAEVKALNKKIKDGQRITDSTNQCYAELVTTHIFYHKAMMYGSNLFTGWIWRQFDGAKLVSEGKGQVKNPLEDFPPKEEAMVEPAKVELRDAFAKDFDEWVVKKSGT
ncbi:MAG: hypothetical protein R3E14_05370 [Erythrobacter sp.]